MPTAIVIDGAFFLRRFGWTFPDRDATDPAVIAQSVAWMAFWHLSHRTLAPDYQPMRWHNGCQPAESTDLYRIFFYDCPPLTKRMHRPVSRQAIDLSKTADARLRLDLHARLGIARKVALRLGRLHDSTGWRLKPAASKRLTDGDMSPLVDDDFELDTKQKGVDMKLGLDVASMAFKRQVDQIVLIAGDGDFVPATKLARREGIDVVLDSMGATPARDLLQHVDGVRSCREVKEAYS